MSSEFLLTKLYLPPFRPGIVSRPRLIERLNEGMYRKLTLISAPAEAADFLNQVMGLNLGRQVSPLWRPFPY
jgi:ATP/maltotriose-dependent transcriptional regulator MalT